MGQLKRDLPNDKYLAATEANSPTATNYYLTLNDLPGGTDTQLISGAASWSGTGMIFNVTNLNYKINGITYNALAASVTLANGDVTYDRFDAIVADDTQTISVITGTPAFNPLTPSIEPNQVLVQYVFVQQGSTTPFVTNQFVYREGTTPDWTSAVIGSAPGQPIANFAYTGPPTPFEGSECLSASFSIYDVNKYIRFTAPVAISRSSYVVLSMRVYLPVNYATLDANVNGRRPAVALYNGNTSLGFIYLDQWGLNRTQTGSWQLVTIPVSAFNLSLSLATITSLRIYNVEFISTTPAYVNIFYDDIKFQTGYGPQTNRATIDISQNSTIIGSTSKINFIDGKNTSVQITRDIPNNKIDVKVDNIYNSVAIINGNGIEYYSSFESALLAAVSGDVITFFSDVNSSVDNVELKNNVDINLNGFTLLCINFTANPFLTDMGNSITVNIFNGNIIRGDGGYVLETLNTSTVINFSNTRIEFQNSSLSGGFAVNNVATLNDIIVIGQTGIRNDGGIINNAYVELNNSYGGFGTSGIYTFGANARVYNSTCKSEGYAAILVATDSKVYNSTGISNTQTGIYVTAGIINNCSGISVSGSGIYVDNSFFNIVNSCIGNSNSGKGIYFFNGEMSNSYGYSNISDGVYVYPSNLSVLKLTNITGKSNSGYGFYLFTAGDTTFTIELTNLVASSNNNIAAYFEQAGAFSTQVVKISNIIATSYYDNASGHAVYIEENYNTFILAGGVLTVKNASAKAITGPSPINIQYGNVTFKIPTGTAPTSNITNTLANTTDLYGNLIIND